MPVYPSAGANIGRLDLEVVPGFQFIYTLDFDDGVARPSPPMVLIDGIDVQTYSPGSDLTAPLGDPWTLTLIATENMIGKKWYLVDQGETPFVIHYGGEIKRWTGAGGPPLSSNVQISAGNNGTVILQAVPVPGPPGTPGTAALSALTSRVSALETTLALAITPQWQVGAESTAVTHAARVADDLDLWIDGTTGYAEIGGTIYGFSANGPVSARWETEPGTFLVNTVDAAVELDAGGYDDIGYAAGGHIYHDTTGGRLFKMYHAERYPDGTPSTTNFWSYLGLAVADEGTPDTWVDLGPVITPERPYVLGEDSHAEITGGPFAIVDHGGDPHMLVWFKDTTDAGEWKGLCAARCPLADVLAATAGVPPTFTKLFGGDWTEPGIGGEADDLLPGADPNPWWFDIVHLVDHDRWLMVYSAPEDAGFSLWARTAVDPLSWGLPQRLTDVEAAWLVYPSLTSPTIVPQREVTGDEVLLTYTRSSTGWPLGGNPWTDAEICQRTLTFDPELAGLGAPEGWTDIDDADLLNGWARANPADTRPIRFYKHAGRGYLQVGPTVTGGASGSTFFELPPGYVVESPTTFEQFPVDITGDGSTFVPLGQATVNDDGRVTLDYFDPTKPGVSGFNISWRIA